MAPIFVGGRRILGALSADPTTGLAAGDEYYNTTDNVKRVYNGTSWSAVGGNNVQSFTALESSISNWAFLPNEDFYDTSNHNGTYYTGSRFRVTNGTGRVEANNYEYPLYGKFALRGSANDTIFYQLYNFAGTASQFTTASTVGNMFQMGLSFDVIPSSLLTNSLEATAAIGAGGCNWFCCSGYGTKTWSFYNGGANDNSESPGATNRESQIASVSWTGQDVTIVLTGDNHPTDPRTTIVFLGTTQLYKWSNQQAAGMTNIYCYIGDGYPNGQATIWSNGLPEFRYGTTTGILNVS